ncbi:MAG: gliding motility-associated C-terminal domain-containing protein [Treponema sp.]|jgi:flagellar hook assembly protein FlgD/flagellar motor protein MotB|nr:gliding motility-associated C-terminal domain-containing protein [Treponema sp.]
MLHKTLLIGLIVLFAGLVPVSRGAGAAPIGADAVSDIYAPSVAGGDGFSTAQGGAPAGALNPAAGGSAQRLVLDAGFLGIPGLGEASGFGFLANGGILYPTKYAVFGGSFRFLHSPFDAFPVRTSYGINMNIAKELYPGMNLGAGINFFIAADWGISGDLGFRYNMGKLGPLDNFTWAAVMRNMGKSTFPTAFTPVLGVSFDFLTLKGQENKPDPLKLAFALDLGAPGFTNMTGKAGLNMLIGGVVSLSASTGFNLNESLNGKAASFVPSVGIGVNLALKPGGKRIMGDRLPSDGDLSIIAAAKPLYDDIWAMGGGVLWTVGVADKRPPLITIDYPETVWISPNNDGKADDLVFPISITDQRYIAAWGMEIRDSEGKLIRTYRNKERRPETQGVRNFISHLTDVKSGVEVPESLRWDGIFEDGSVAPDGSYFFSLTASDDNGNTAATSPYEVVVDNTPPQVTLEAVADAQRIFSPDGDGNKETLEIRQLGSMEDLWEAGIYDASGNLIKSFSFTRRTPGNILWDGTDNRGLIAPDGVYTYRISATDRALNRDDAALENIIINTIQPAVHLLITDAWFSPNGDGVKDRVSLNLDVPVKEGITGWTVLIRDSSGVTRRTLSGAGNVPEQLDFDGSGDEGRVLGEGVYQGNLSVNYRNGYVSTAVSPPFNLDITPPRAAVRAEYTAFSPNNDGNQDDMHFLQEGTNEISWVGEIRRADIPGVTQPVRTVRFNGTPPSQFTWDGNSDTGGLAPDGVYRYELFSVDAAGNTGRSTPVRITLTTADTPVLLSTDLRAFSPNNDGVKDTITLNPQIQVREGITDWKIDIYSGEGTGGPIVRTFSGGTTVPAAVPWNGRNNTGASSPDGTYTARIELRYVQGNQPIAFSRPFTLDTETPKAVLFVPFTLFSPNGDGERDFIPIRITTEGDEEWNAVITDPQGQVIRSWNWFGSAPSLPWDGTDQAGNNAPDGTYQFALNSVDEAGNSTQMGISNITLDARIPRAFLTASAGAIAPKAVQTTGAPAAALRFGIILNPADGIEDWKLELRDEGGNLYRSFSAAGGQGQTPPASINWNGLNAEGAVREGTYTPVLTVSYTKGDQVSAAAPPVLVDISGPVLSFNSRPEYFSPDNDGVDDELIMTLGARDVSPIASWSLEIREPQPPYPVFYRIEGRGSPAERSIWDGRSSKGELVQAATDYPFTFRAEDTLGNGSSLSGIIGIDVLVIRDGDHLKIQVPSIIFRENAADFISLPVETVENNIRVLRRVAEILNKFKDYRVLVEGHANPTTATRAAREREERNELLPLSESRARVVVNLLTEYGVARSRLSSVGIGGTRPVVKFEDHDNWWKNRRVEFILLK